MSYTIAFPRHRARLGFAVAAGVMSTSWCAAADARDRTEPSAASNCSARLDDFKLASDAHRIDAAERALQAAEKACGSTAPEDKHRLAADELAFGQLIYPENAAEALVRFRAASALEPDNPKVALSVSGALITLHKYNDALVIIDGALARHPDSRDVRFKLEYNAGFAWLNICVADRQSDITKPEGHFQRAIELNPDFPDSYEGLASIVHDRRHECARATALYKQACDRGLERACVQYRWFTAKDACHKNP